MKITTVMPISVPVTHIRSTLIRTVTHTSFFPVMIKPIASKFWNGKSFKSFLKSEDLLDESIERTDTF